MIIKRCSDVCLTIRPDKCFSLVIGSCKKDKTVFKVADGMTNDIKNSPTTFLGSVVGSSKYITKKTASKRLLTQFCSTLVS